MVQLWAYLPVILALSTGILANPDPEPVPQIRPTTTRRSTPPPPTRTPWWDAIVTDSSTQRWPFYLRVWSSNPQIDGRTVTLRPDTRNRGVQRAVIDANFDSPILALEMRGGALYPQTRDNVNQWSDIGPVGGFRNLTYERRTLTGRAEFIFTTLTRRSNSDFRRSYNRFQLVGGGDAPQYNLYSRVPTGVTNGFTACRQRDAGGIYWQLVYTTTARSSGTVDPPNCEYIALIAQLSIPPNWI